MTQGSSGTRRTEDRFDSLVRRVSERRRDSISRSMQRPLKVEALRTLYLAACVLVDLLLIPIALSELVGRVWMLLVLFVVIPAAIAELRLHHMWFVEPYAGRASPNPPEK